jgi:hypothetical protein
LLFIGLLVEPVHFSHLLDLVQVHDETPLVGVIFLDALSAEHRKVVGAIKVLDSLVVLVAQQAVDALLVLEVNVSQDAVALHDLVQDVEVERQFVHAFDLLNQLSANWAPDSIVVVQHREAFSAESVSAMNQNPGDSFSDVEFVSAIVAEVESPDLVVGLDQLHVLSCLFVGFELFLGVFALLLERVGGSLGVRWLLGEAVGPGFRVVRRQRLGSFRVVNRLHWNYLKMRL